MYQMTREGRDRSRPYDQALGRVIRRHRLELGMSQARLALQLDLTFQQVQKYETGSNRVVFGRFMDLCRVLQVDPGDLCREVEAELGNNQADDAIRPEHSRGMIDFMQAGQAVDANTRRRVTALLRACAGADADDE